MANGGEETSANVKFHASKGWFDNFKHRFLLHNVNLLGKPASADHVAADVYSEILKKLIEEKGYKPEQVFSADESAIFWKKMSSWTFISKEEGSLSQKPWRITLLSSFVGMLQATWSNLAWSTNQQILMPWKGRISTCFPCTGCTRRKLGWRRCSSLNGSIAAFCWKCKSIYQIRGYSLRFSLYLTMLLGIQSLISILRRGWR